MLANHAMHAAEELLQPHAPQLLLGLLNSCIMTNVMSQALLQRFVRQSDDDNNSQQQDWQLCILWNHHVPLAVLTLVGLKDDRQHQRAKCPNPTVIASHHLNVQLLRRAFSNDHRL